MIQNEAGSGLKTTVDNYTLLEFFNLPMSQMNEVLVWLKFIPKRETKRSIFHMKLKHVEFFKRVFSSSETEYKDLIKVISKVQKMKKSDVLDMRVIEFFSLIASVKAQLLVIHDAEVNGLVSEHVDRKWEIVRGSERMAKFGILNTLDSLSNGDPLKYEIYENKSYAWIFSILHMRKIKNDLQIEMSNLKTI